MAMALVELFQVRHTHSYDFWAKKQGPVFIQSVTILLLSHGMLIVNKLHERVSYFSLWGAQ